MAWFPDSVHGRLSNRLAANTDERTEGGGIPSAAADKPWVPTAVGERCLHGGATVPERPFMPSCQGRPDTAGPSVPGLPAGPYENAAFGRPVRSRGGMALRSEERRERRYRRRRMSREARRRDAILATGGLDAALSLRSLVDASHHCQRGVAWKRNVQGFCLNRVLQCARLYQMWLSGAYAPGEAKRFTVSERGKTRSISAVPFRDRVVQRALCDTVLVPLVRRTLIYDNGASLKGKGTSFSLDRLERHLREHYRRHGAVGGILLFDFSKFFESIDVNKLVAMMDGALGYPPLVRFVELFLRSEERGLGLGNQTSQTGAIFYPSGIDHWVKETWRVRGYGRYMDDGYALFADWDEMKRFAIAFQKQCAALGIAVNSRKFRMVPATAPFVFLKTRFQLDERGRVHRRVCAEGLKREKRRLRKFRSMIGEGRISYGDAARSYASWRGTLARGDAAGFLQCKMDRYFYAVFGVPWRECLACQ